MLETCCAGLYFDGCVTINSIQMALAFHHEKAMNRSFSLYFVTFHKTYSFDSTTGLFFGSVEIFNQPMGQSAWFQFHFAPRTFVFRKWIEKLRRDSCVDIFFYELNWIRIAFGKIPVVLFVVFINDRIIAIAWIFSSRFPHSSLDSLVSVFSVVFIMLCVRSLA